MSELRHPLPGLGGAVSVEGGQAAFSPWELTAASGSGESSASFRDGLDGMSGVNEAK